MIECKKWWKNWKIHQKLQKSSKIWKIHQKFKNFIKKWKIDVKNLKNHQKFIKKFDIQQLTYF